MSYCKPEDNGYVLEGGGIGSGKGFCGFLCYFTVMNEYGTCFHLIEEHMHGSFFPCLTLPECSHFTE